MRHTIALALVLLTAPAAAFAEEPEENARDDEKIRPTITGPAVATPELKLAPVAVEARAPAEESAALDMPERGSFWWVVGAIVVAGVILAVVL